jgi:hypothetical protein
MWDSCGWRGPCQVTGGSYVVNVVNKMLVASHIRCLSPSQSGLSTST